MRLLLISYEFPPIESAQSFRWHYLGRHLARKGVDVTVLTPELSAKPSLADSHEFRVLRTYPGPFVGSSALVASKTRGSRTEANERQEPRGENRAEKVYRALRKLLDNILFPDVRTEWYPFARSRLGKLRDERFDLVVASHEPGVDLMLGMHAARKLRIPLVIDLADPLVTPYSPVWRKSLDNRLERSACEAAAGVITTSQVFSADLVQKHGLDPHRVIEIEQGFEGFETSGQMPETSKPFPKDQFWMLFTGNFYKDFRNPEILLQALKQRPGVKLAYAGHTPDWLLDLFAPLGRQVQCLGRMSHRQVLELQRFAPVLFNLGNKQARQVPGKLYEYYGARRPIMHVALNRDDPSKEEILSRRRGIAVDAELARVVEALDRFQAAWAVGALETEWDLSCESVAEFSWEKLADKLLGFLQSQLADTGKS